MMKSTSRETIFILCLLVIIFTIMGCVTPLQGKRILLSTIIDNSKNTTNLFYYNPKQTVGYELYYSSSSAMQPVVSYFWYSLKKAFECVGIRIEEYGLAYDAELSLTFTSLTDEEIKFTAVLIKMGKWLYTRDYVVSMPKVQTDENSILEQRAYGMLDSIATTILNDQNFQKALLDNAVPSAAGNQKYERIRGIILKNGDVIRGEVLNMNVNTVQIRTIDGKVLSYSFVEEVQSLITE
jgi:hypothetical protein